MSALPDSSSSPRPEDAQSFDPFVFWIKNKSSIQAIAGLFILGMGLYGYSEWRTAANNAAAADAFADAKSAEQLTAFISSHSGTPLSGNAALLLAEKQRNEKKFEDSTKTLRSFLDKLPTHPLAPAARLSLAANFEVQGKTEEALAAYKDLTASDLRGFATPVAWLRIARILKAQGKKEDAKAAYDSIQSQFPKSVFASDALMEAQELTPKAPEPTPAAAETPAPAPIAPPAPATPPATSNPANQ